MKSGLEDRNNSKSIHTLATGPEVSMKSGLEDRNNRRTVKYQKELEKSQ